jgi:D-alanine-D-alanine ligase
VEVDKNDFSIQVEGKKIKFDYAYNTIHGCPGENGRLQGYFDLLQIPYSSSGVLVAALTFNKYVNNQFLKTQQVRVADSILLRRNREWDIEDIISRLGLPVFVKPNDSGSSFGITKVKEASRMQAAIEKAFAEGQEVMIEQFIEGTEVTCGCYKTPTKQVVFPVTEVVSDNEFFDYDAKYNGEVQEITPARISDELTIAVQQETLRVYDLIDARGIIRIDYIISTDNQLILLEINTNPGMTETSFIPQQISAAGLDIKNVLTDIIENI